MKQYLIGFIFLIGCNNAGYDKPENAFDAAREFISAKQKGDFKRASFYVLPAENKENLVNRLQQQYQQLPGEEKFELHEASIIIDEDQTINDSVHIILYKDSYTRQSHRLKVVFRNERWWAAP